MSAPTIRSGRPGDVDRCLGIARRLSPWFTERGLRHMAADFPFQRLLVATDGPALRGFLSFFVHEGMARIGWMGVDPERHRQGIGRALVDALVATLRPAGVEGVLVDTLGDAVDYAPYARTRAFYRALGFADFRRVTQDDPECPEQLTLRLDLTGGERSG